MKGNLNDLTLLETLTKIVIDPEYCQKRKTTDKIGTGIQVLVPGIGTGVYRYAAIVFKGITS
jgi:hypothetical protein